MVIPENFSSKLMDLLGAVTSMAWNLLLDPAGAIVVPSSILACTAFLISRRKGTGVCVRAARTGGKGFASGLRVGQCSAECERLDQKIDASLPPEYRGVLWNKETIDALTWLKRQTRRI